MLDATFCVEAGEHVVLLGASGSGKSTLLRLIARLITPQAGSVKVLGSLAFVQQDPLVQIVGATVSEDVMFGPLNLGLSVTQAEARARKALVNVGAAHLASCLTSRLSSGELQLVALAGALAMEPKVLLLDEPLAYLDAHQKACINLLFQHLRAAGMCIVEATHSLSSCRKASKVLLLRGGRPDVISTTRSTECKANAELTFMQSMREVRHTLKSCGILPVQDHQLSTVQRHTSPPTKPLAQLTLRSQPALELQPGDSVAIVGCTGSGKTSFLHSLIGLNAAGIPVKTASASVWQLHTQRVAMLFQQPEQYFWGTTLLEEIDAISSPSRTASAHIRANTLTKHIDANELTARLGLPSGCEQRRLTTLSDGEQRRAALAVALIRNPQLLIADNPFTGLDLPAKRLVASVLQEYVARGGCLVFSTHERRHLNKLAQKCIVLQNNTPVCVDNTTTVLRSPQLLRTAGLVPNRNQIEARTTVLH